MNRLLGLSAALALAASTCAYANSHKEAPMLAATASASTAAPPTRLGDCSKQAKGKKGDEYKAAVKTCMSAGGAASAPATAMRQQDKTRK